MLGNTPGAENPGRLSLSRRSITTCAPSRRWFPAASSKSKMISRSCFFHREETPAISSATDSMRGEKSARMFSPKPSGWSSIWTTARIAAGGEPSSSSGLLNSPMPRGWKSGWPISRHTTANTIRSSAIGAVLKNHGTAICSTA